MVRYGKIRNKNEREIVLLKGYPCIWGKCSFCDYIMDNSQNEKEMLEVNREVLQNVTGEYGVLEVINSGSVFELPAQTLADIKALVKEKGIYRLCLESYYAYKDRLQEMREFFGVDIIYKCGIETFDNEFRNKILKKGIVFKNPKEVSEYFESVCLLVGVEGQTKEMIKRDIEIMLEYFSYGCVNLFTNNTTPLKADEELISWFKETYAELDKNPNIDILWTNTDFSVGGEAV